MKIVICGSMIFSKKMIEIEEKLLEVGHEAILPVFTKEYAKLNNLNKVHSESVRNKVEKDLIKDYYDKIKENEALLVVNEPKNGIEHYIGGNTFLEMGFAHVLDKKIFLLYNTHQMNYSDEIKAMNPICLNGKIEEIC